MYSLLLADITLGENAIVIVSGANLTLGPADVASAESLFLKAAVVVCQLEVPPETSLAALVAGKKHGGLFLVSVHVCLSHSGVARMAKLSLAQYVCRVHESFCTKSREVYRSLGHVPPLSISVFLTSQVASECVLDPMDNIHTIV